MLTEDEAFEAASNMQPTLATAGVIVAATLTVIYGTHCVVRDTKAIAEKVRIRRAEKKAVKANNPPSQ